jgi:hypothetical protein
MRWNLATDYLLHAECCRRQGDLARARADLQQARELFADCGADGWVARTVEKLAQL